MKRIQTLTAKTKVTLAREIMQGKIAVTEASRIYHSSPSEIEGWGEDAKNGMENVLRAKPVDIKEPYGATDSPVARSLR
jgi:hypothetical protein